MTAGSTIAYVPLSDPRKMTREQLIHLVEQHRQRIATLVAMIDAHEKRPKWARCDNCGKEIESADRAERRRKSKAGPK